MVDFSLDHIKKFLTDNVQKFAIGKLLDLFIGQIEGGKADEFILGIILNSTLKLTPPGQAKATGEFWTALATFLLPYAKSLILYYLKKGKKEDPSPPLSVIGPPAPKK